MHPLIEKIIMKRHKGEVSGVYSACSASPFVIEAVIERAIETNTIALIEATANQVNQFGGYTGMEPQDFYDFVYKIAKEKGLPKTQLILGGDHLGPLTWQDENEVTAMEKSRELVRQFVAAGFTKIHLDTSMRLADDDQNTPLSDAVIARRAAELAEVCEKAYQEEVLKADPQAEKPVYIIGSEVPIPGGAQDDETLQVTKPEDAENTIETYRKLFAEKGLEDAFSRVIGLVVQPGVEFGDDTVDAYDREKAKALCAVLEKHPSIVFEGHSTDYQTPQKLREMVEDGIAILKVGPALTFAFREALFALENIEQEVISVESERSQFRTILLNELQHTPKYWKKYYHGDQVALKMKYSYSDRSRYIFQEPRIQRAIEDLIQNIDSHDVPLSLLSQYMPLQYARVCDGSLPMTAEALIKNRIQDRINDYLYAIES